MKISEIYKKTKPAISFEFFPPKTDEAEQKLYETAAELKELRPSFISVTYGAMGSTRDNTLRIAERIKNKIGIEAAAHLTCVAQSRDDIEGVLAQLAERGIENIVALRGDPPKGEAEFRPPVNGFAHAFELVRFIRRHSRFNSAFALAVAGYPEGHIECKDKQKDLDHLKLKVDQGADAVITQLFFNNADYFDFVERARKAGITIPIVPGIMPLTNISQIKRFADMCGCAIPAVMQAAMARLSDDAAGAENYGIEYATRQCRELIDGGVPGIHFYTLNKSRATQDIYRGLGLGTSSASPEKNK